MLGANGSGECVSVNEQLWQSRRDPTTQPVVWALFAFFYALIIIGGCVGNLCVILAISRTKSLQTVPNMFIFSLSCSDFMVCLTSATITPITAFAKAWLFGSLFCSVAPFLAGTSLSFSTFTLAAISIDRFMLIRFPMKKPFGHTQAFMIICLICTMAMGLSMPVALMHTLTKISNYCGMYCYEDWGPYSSQRRAYGTVVLTVQFIIPLSIIIICYTAISVRLGQSLILKGKKRDYQWQLQMNDQHRAATKRRQRTNRMFIAMVVAFSLSWVWSVVFNVLKDYDLLPAYVASKEYIIGITLHCIAMTSTVWNPLLYAMMNIQLRAAFIQLMPDCIRDRLSREDKPRTTLAQSCKPRPSTLLSANGNADTSNLPSGCQTPRSAGWLTPAFLKTGPRNSITSLSSAFSSGRGGAPPDECAMLAAPTTASAPKTYGTMDGLQWQADFSDDVKSAASGVPQNANALCCWAWSGPSAQSAANNTSRVRHGRSSVPRRLGLFRWRRDSDQLDHRLPPTSTTTATNNNSLLLITNQNSCPPPSPEVRVVPSIKIDESSQNSDAAEDL